MKTLKVFSATWCNPCTQLKNTLNQLKDCSVNVVIVDIDAWKDVAKESNVRSIPTSILYVDEVEVRRKVGSMSLQELKLFLD